MQCLEIQLDLLQYGSALNPRTNGEADEEGREFRLCVYILQLLHAIMDISSLEQGIRSIASSADIPKNEPARLSLLSASRALVRVLEQPDEAISNVAVVSVRKPLTLAAYG